MSNYKRIYVTVKKFLLMALVVLFTSALGFAASKPIKLNTPQECWEAVLRAMRTGKERKVRKVTTENGFDSLIKWNKDKNQKAMFVRRGTQWAQWDLRWKQVNDQTAEAFAGPEIVENGLSFVNTLEGWKLDEWRVGE